jgi:hypothetical protein
MEQTQTGNQSAETLYKIWTSATYGMVDIPAPNGPKLNVDSRKQISYYKAFNSDLTCRSDIRCNTTQRQFEIGETYTHTGPVELYIRGCSGHSCCKSILQSSYHYNPARSRFCEIQVSGIVEDCCYLSVAETITIGREITGEELMEALTGTMMDDNNSTKIAYTRGKINCENGPAIVGMYFKEWWVDGKLHRLDGPARDAFIPPYKGIPVWDLEWWVNGKKHRLDGPAIENCQGGKEWWVAGEKHREGGPAVEHTDGSNEWWINGVFQFREETPLGFVRLKNVERPSYAGDLTAIVN